MGGSRDFEKGGTLCRPPWLTDEENSRFQMVKKGQNNVRNYFLTNYFYQHFQTLSIFTYYNSLMMKSYQVFRF